MLFLFLTFHFDEQSYLVYCKFAVYDRLKLETVS